MYLENFNIRSFFIFRNLYLYKQELLFQVHVTASVYLYYLINNNNSICIAP